TMTGASRESRDGRAYSQWSAIRSPRTAMRRPANEPAESGVLPTWSAHLGRRGRQRGLAPDGGVLARGLAQLDRRLRGGRRPLQPALLGQVEVAAHAHERVVADGVVLLARGDR